MGSDPPPDDVRLALADRFAVLEVARPSGAHVTSKMPAAPLTPLTRSPLRNPWALRRSATPSRDRPHSAPPPDAQLPLPGDSQNTSAPTATHYAHEAEGRRTFHLRGMVALVWKDASA